MYYFKFFIYDFWKIVEYVEIKGFFFKIYIFLVYNIISIKGYLLKLWYFIYLVKINKYIEIDDILLDF